MKSLKAILLCLALLSAVVGLCAQPQEIIWDVQENFKIEAMDANASGNVVIAGITYRNGGDYYIYSIKQYNSDGALLWSKEIADFQYGGASTTPFDLYELSLNDYGEVFFYNIQNMIYVTNQYYWGNPPTGPNLAAGITKLSSMGEFLWNSPVSSSYPWKIRIEVTEDLAVVTGLMTTCSSTIPPPSLPSGGSPSYQVAAVLNNQGLLQSYNYIYSNWECHIVESYIQGSKLYIAGCFGYYLYHNWPAFLCFQHSVGGNTVISYLYEDNGNAFVAQLDLLTATWSWETNIDYQQDGGWGYYSEANLCVISNNVYFMPNPWYSYSIYKLNSITGVVSDYRTDLFGRYRRLYTTIDNRLHFYGDYSDDVNSVYGVINEDLSISEFYENTIQGGDYYHSSDYLGNQYERFYWSYNPDLMGFKKFGYPNPYPVRPELTPVTYNNCYPEVLYESDIPFVNIGNSPLTASGLQFINATSGLTAAVLSGSPAASGDTLWVRVSLNAYYTGAFSDTLVVVSNSPYVPEYKVRISGNLVAVPPLEPEGINIAVNGNNVIISWSAVTETIFDTPINPDYYLVFISNDPYDDFTFLGATEGLQFTQPLVASFQLKMFYRVVAYKYYGRGSIDFAYLGLVPGMPEAEVLRLLDE